MCHTHGLPCPPHIPCPPYIPCIPLDGAIPGIGGGGGQYGKMPGQYVNQIQMARPGGMGVNMVQQPALPHMIPSYNPPMGAGVRPFSKLGATVPQSPLMSLGPTLSTSSEQSVSPQHAPPPSQQPHTPPPPDPQMLQTQPPHSQPLTFSPMNQTQSSSLQPATTSSPPSTSQLQPQGVPRPGSSTQQELVSESVVYVTLTVLLYCKGRPVALRALVAPVRTAGRAAGRRSAR